MTERLDFEIQLRTEAAQRGAAALNTTLNATGKDMGKAMAASAKAGIAEAQAAAERASAAARRGAAPASAIPSAFGGVVQGARVARGGAPDLSGLRAIPASAWSQASAERSAVPWMQPGAKRTATPASETVKVSADTAPATGAWQRLRRLFGGGVDTPVRVDTKGAESSLSGLQRLALGVGSAMATISAGREILETGMAFQRVQTTLNAATGNATLAAAEFDYVRDVSSRLGLSLRTTAEDYSKFAAATKGTAIEGRATHAVFEGMASASAVLNLRADQVSLSLKALQQMVSKGKVSSEELNQQLGDHLPGALQIASRAMGVTTAQLAKMMADGKLHADAFLPRFAEQLQREFGPGAAAAANSLRANLNRAGNAWDELKNRVFSGGFEAALSSQMQRLTTILGSPEAMAAATSLGEGIGSAISMAGSAFAFVIEHADAVKAALVGLGAVGAAATMSSLATSAMGLAAALGPVGIAAAAVVGGLYYFRDAAIDLGGEQVALKDLILGAWDAISDGVATASDEVVGWVRTKWGAIQAYFGEMGVNLTGFAAGAISAWTATMRGIWDVVKATVSDIGGAFSSLGTAVKLSLSGNFSEAGQALARGFSASATFEAAEKAGASAAAAYRAGMATGDVRGAVGEYLSTAWLAGDSLTGGALSGTASAVADRARQRANQRQEQERKDAEARTAREAQARTDRERRDREHGEWLNRQRPGAAVNDNGKKGGSGSGDTAARQLEGLRARNAELQGLNGAYQQGERAVTAITAAYEAEKAVLALGTKATAAQKDEARRLAVANRELEDANKRLLEAMKKVEESKKKADNLISSYGIERQELEALSAVYRSGNDDIEQRVAQLAREKELREKIRDLTADDAARVRAEAAKTAEQAAQTERDKKNYEYMKRYYDGIADAAVSAFNSVRDGSKSASEGVRDFAKAVSDLAMQQFVMAPLKNALSSLASGLGGSLGLGSANAAGGGGQQDGGVLGSALKSAGSWIGNGIGSLFGGGATPAVAGARAGGGPVLGGSNYRVNEMGGRPEWFVAPLDGRVLTDAQMRGTAGGGSGGGARSGGGAPINIVWNISTPNPTAFRESQAQMMARTRDMVAGAGRYR
ncbi:tape measure protein [Roseomonas sp. GC11]|uniref:tape measure protein n=1 Tax=Roseomonas sp. GC11 TaxID=2950546 RepID=UPI00210C5792|nr:tape measure protein [Roseomonas sp. GC11]MCQ4160860.1 tape measure protein [Roseomonas sp. GC11]